MNRTFVNQVHTFFQLTLIYGSRFSQGSHISREPVNLGSHITQPLNSLTIYYLVQSKNGNIKFTVGEPNTSVPNMVLNCKYRHANSK